MPYTGSREHRLYYEVRGNGPLLLCLGGWGVITGNGHERLPNFLRRNFSTIVFDIRGLGSSTYTGDAFTTADLSDDAADVVAAAGGSRLSVFGFGGLGACVAQHFAIRYPELTDRLVLMQGWAGPDTFKQAQGRTFVELLTNVGLASFRRFAATLAYTPEYFNEHHYEILGDGGHWGELEGREEELAKIMVATIEHDARDSLGKISAPTLIICNELDIVDPPRLSHELQRLIPGSELVVLPETPHATRSNREALTALDGLLEGFLVGDSNDHQARPHQANHVD